MKTKSDTKERILDAAETMFADRGFDAVPVREIMRLADAQLGLLSYHFGNKETLFEAVIARRIDVLSSRRRDALAFIAGTPESSVETVVDAFVRPYLDFMLNGGPGWEAYGRLVAQLAQSARWSGLVHKYFDSTAALFIAEIGNLFPGTVHEQIVEAFVFSVGAMLNTFAMTGRMATLSDGRIEDDQLGEICLSLIKFMAGGIEAVLERHKA